MTAKPDKEEAIIENDEKQGKGKAFDIIKKVLINLIALLILVGAFIFANSQSPDKSIFGFRFYTVLTPSMSPTYNVGDLVIVKMAEGNEIAVGDIITFNPSEDSGAYLTHRVTAVMPDHNGTSMIFFKTKGDANTDEDSFETPELRLVGKVVFGIPKLGYVIRFIQLRWYIAVGVVVLLFVFIGLKRYYFALKKDDDDDTEDSDDDING